MGVRRARAFADDEGDEDELDFDRPTRGAGKALADALRSSNPFAPSREDKAAMDAAAIPVPTHRSVPGRAGSVAAPGQFTVYCRRVRRLPRRGWTDGDGGGS